MDPDCHMYGPKIKVLAFFIKFKGAKTFLVNTGFARVVKDALGLVLRLGILSYCSDIVMGFR